MDDHEIVDLYWQRDEHAIEATAAKYESYCMKISQNILSDRADSEENVNDTYLHAWQAMPPQRPAILSAFLGKIARNLALNRLRQNTAQKRGGGEAAPVFEEVAELLKTGAGRGFSWVLQKSVNMTQRGSVVALYTANAAKYLK